MFNQAIKWELVDKNPNLKATKPKKKKKRKEDFIKFHKLMILDSRIAEYQRLKSESSKNEELIKKCEDSKSDTHNKEEFFRIYQAYKNGQIKKEHLLITDLIDIELMMMEEKALLDKKILNERENIIQQKNKLDILTKQKIKLEKKL